MKRLLLLFALALLPLAASAGAPATKKVSKTRITSVISEVRRQDGVEVVRQVMKDYGDGLGPGPEEKGPSQRYQVPEVEK